MKFWEPLVEVGTEAVSGSGQEAGTWSAMQSPSIDPTAGMCDGQLAVLGDNVDGTGASRRVPPPAYPNPTSAGGRAPRSARIAPSAPEEGSCKHSLCRLGGQLSPPRVSRPRPGRWPGDQHCSGLPVRNEDGDAQRHPRTPETLPSRLPDYPGEDPA